MKASSLFAYGVYSALTFGCAVGIASNAHAAPGFYRQHNLVSDGFPAADHTDVNLVNAWGVAFNPFGPVWVADNGTGVSTLYDGAGNVQSLVVQIPTPTSTSGGNPTGIVFNASTRFVVSKAAASGPSVFLFATEDGVIAGWAPSVDSTHAIRAVDNSVQTGAIYKGLALSAGGNGQLLYAADFHNGRVDVFDSAFQPATLPVGAFSDPGLPADFAPFGIQAIGGDIVVTYAEQDAAAEDEIDGPGLGYVDVYNPNGRLLHRIASQGSLNAPWGVALAPAGFGQFANSLLIGNFGDGRINAYNPVSHAFIGSLKGQNRMPIHIQGLWGIAFGSGSSAQPVDTLFFAAGPAGESHGLYGRLDSIGGADIAE